MTRLDSVIGIKPFTVLVDDSAELNNLLDQGQDLRHLEYEDRKKAVIDLTLGAMENAYENMITKSNDFELSRDIVVNTHPLSFALQNKLGCCRYQGALFFALGYAAELGDKQFVQAAPVNRQVNSVFNELVYNGTSEVVSIFAKSLRDPKLDYSQENPQVFEQAFKWLPNYNFYSYHQTPEGIALVENPGHHLVEL